MLTFRGNVSLKAVNADQMIGFIAGDLKQAEHTGWIVTLGVTAACRRQGVASMLLEICERRMARPRICLCVRRTNQAAIALYTKAGYQQSGLWRSYYHDGEDALVFEKMLKNQHEH